MDTERQTVSESTFSVIISSIRRKRREKGRVEKEEEEGEKGERERKGRGCRRKADRGRRYTRWVIRRESRLRNVNLMGKCMKGEVSEISKAEREEWRR